jgi:geranylgeranyl pyrophosphate synthase
MKPPDSRQRVKGENMPQGAAVRSNVLPARCDRSAASEPRLPSDPTWNFNELRASLEEDWRQALGRHSLPPLTEMMSYALSGGKCLRGLLLLAVVDSCNGSREQAREAAVAIEMLHGASLVVDDLPALDDASVRRGTLSLYKRFGEAAAILTAHSLVAAAFEVVAQISSEPDRLLRITRLLAAAIGARGMARAELVGPCDSVGSDTDVRALKTGSLFQMAAHIGAVLAGVEPELAEDLGQLGMRLGICYQLVDDFRDDFADESNRGALREAGRRSWNQCAELFNLLRGRLHRAHPMETWLSRFHDAGAKIVDAPASGSRNDP